MSDNNITDYLAEHPRMIGVLFAALLLLTQVGSVAGGGLGSIPGP